MARELDPNSKNDQAMMSYLKGKSILIAGGNANSRTSIRSFTKGLNIETKDVHVAQTIGQALQIVEEKKPAIIITDYLIDEKSCLPVLQKHLRVQPDRSQTISLVYGSPTPHPDHAKSLDHFVDAFLQKPLVINQLEKRFFEILKERSQMDSKKRLISKGLAPYFAGKYEQALTAIEKLEEKDVVSPHLYTIKGLIKEEKKEYEEAIESYNQGLKQQPENYYCAKGSFRTLIGQGQYREAYSPLKEILKGHPINPSDIPEMTKVFVVKEQFDEVLDFVDSYVSFENFDQIDQGSDKGTDEETLSESFERIAICLIAVAKFFLKKGEKKKAKETLMRATKLIDIENIKVMGNIISELINIGENDQAYDFIIKISPKKLDDNLTVLKLFLEQDKLSPQETLKKGLGLIQKGVKDFRIYNMVIQKSVSLDKRDEFIDDIIVDAEKIFPDMKDHFQRMKNQRKQ